jgi:hypothetical protein
MTFLVCRVHLHSKLGEFMVVVVTDRTQLQDQLSETLKLSESDVELARTVYSQLGDIGETASPATRSFSPPPRTAGRADRRRRTAPCRHRGNGRCHVD